MGWTFSHATEYKNGRVDRKAECDKVINSQTETRTDTVLKSVMKGTTYYAAVETIKNGTREVWAAVFLTSSDKKDPYWNFGYKDMDETMGPYKYDCPARILDLLTPTDNAAANYWRNECRRQAEIKKDDTLNKLPIGAMVKWTNCDGDEMILVKHAPCYQFKTWFWFCESRRSYVRRNMVNITNAVVL